MGLESMRKRYEKPKLRRVGQLKDVTRGLLTNIRI